MSVLTLSSSSVCGSVWSSGKCCWSLMWRPKFKSEHQRFGKWFCSSLMEFCFPTLDIQFLFMDISCLYERVLIRTPQWCGAITVTLGGNWTVPHSFPGDFPQQETNPDHLTNSGLVIPRQERTTHSSDRCLKFVNFMFVKCFSSLSSK